MNIKAIIHPAEEGGYWAEGLHLFKAEAVADYDRALRSKPDDYITWETRGIALYNLNEYEEAVSSFDKALEYKPDDDYPWYIKARIYG